MDSSYQRRCLQPLGCPDFYRRANAYFVNTNKTGQNKFALPGQTLEKTHGVSPSTTNGGVEFLL
jgi:hypothetical protein